MYEIFTIKLGRNKRSLVQLLSFGTKTKIKNFLKSTLGEKKISMERIKK